MATCAPSSSAPLIVNNTVIASYTLVADSVYCDYDPIKKKANIGSNFLERELF